MATRPPFTGLTDMAAAMATLVPDTKTGRSDADFIGDALDRYAEAYPCWETADIGDGTTTAWDLSASPFTGFVLGYSDQFDLEVQELDSSVPQSPPVLLLPSRDFWLERRYAGGTPKLYLVFRDAPEASPSQVRVTWRRRWAVTAAPLNEVPLHHQMAVVFRGAAYKARALASYYRRSVDATGGSDSFAAIETADSYVRQAKDWEAEYDEILGIGDQTELTEGVAHAQRTSVFPRRSG